MTWFIGQSLSILVLAVLLGVAVGYLIWGRRFELLDSAPRVNKLVDLTSAEKAAAPAAASAPAAAAKAEGTGATKTAKGKAGKKAAEQAPATPAATATAVATDDDLSQISGVGEKVNNALRAAGLGSYRAIADADDETLRSALAAGKVRLAPTLSSWSAQAQLLADGDLKGHAKLKKTLDAGRNKSERS